jgi:hypothetical protein
MKKMQKYLAIFLLMLFASFSWHNMYYIHVRAVAAASISTSSSDITQYEDFHDCSWDGDDILFEKPELAMNPIPITSGLIIPAFEEPQRISFAIWQPPEISS